MGEGFLGYKLDIFFLPSLPHRLNKISFIAKDTPRLDNTMREKVEQFCLK
jgi:hypothetical protein